MLPTLSIGACSALLVAALAIGARAQTQQVHWTLIQSPPLTGPWSTTFTFPRADPSVGILGRVQVHVEVWTSGTIGVENLGPTSVGALTIPGVDVYTSGAAVMHVNPAFEGLYTLGLPPFDGTQDYGGSSGTTASFVDAQGTGQFYHDVWLTSPFDLEAFNSRLGGPSTIDLHIQGTPFVQAHAQVATSCQPSFTLYVEFKYDYYPGPLPICWGDMFSSWGGCPCGEIPPSITGCPNSAHPNGALLVGTGAASLASDGFVLTATDMTGSTALFLQGDDLTDGVVFLGDGKRCVDGTLLRLGTSVITGGSAVFPGPGQPSVSVRGQVQAPGTRYYQAYYRNTVPHCTPATFNLTSGVAVWWAP